MYARQILVIYHSVGCLVLPSVHVVVYKQYIPNNLQFLHLTLLMVHFSEPTMKILDRVVIPKIRAEWERVAYSMNYDLNIISAIQKESRNLRDGCQKLLIDWLTTSNGPTPKTWKTLLECIEDVEELTAAVEEIKAKLVKGNESTLFVMMFT